MSMDYSDEPRLTIKTVCAQIGILPVTLRAWERRYAVLNPYRSLNRYRLYSERDIAVLRWIKIRVDNGTAISAAVLEFREMLNSGSFPASLPNTPTILPVQSYIPPDQCARQLYQAFISQDETRASDLLREAQSNFDLNTFFLKVIAPVMTELGDAWFYGKIHVTTEHFASAIIRGRLLTLFQSYPIRRTPAHILIGCAPDEHHEIGCLMFATLLRSVGYHVEYLGPDLPITDLVNYSDEVHPDLVILVASMEGPALQLFHVQDKLDRLQPKPIFGFAGKIFIQKTGLQLKIKGIYLGDSMDQALLHVRDVLNRHPS